MSLTGPGLFSGESATLTFGPADADSGITFIREQDGKIANIQARVENVLKRPQRTCLRNGSLFVETIEHCMAALSGLEIDNATVRVAGGMAGEIPGGDGSSRVFVEALSEAGWTDQDAAKQPLIITEPVTVSDGDASISALPGPTDRLEIVYEFEAPAPVGRQVFSFHVGADDFITQLAPARTFSFEAEAREAQCPRNRQDISRLAMCWSSALPGRSTINSAFLMNVPGTRRWIFSVICIWSVVRCAAESWVTKAGTR